MEDQILADACLPDGLGAGPHMDGWVEESEKYEGSGRWWSGIDSIHVLGSCSKIKKLIRCNEHKKRALKQKRELPDD